MFHATSMLRCALALSAIAMLAASTLSLAAPPQSSLFNPDRHMTVDEVEPGMTGYGLTVFHGTTPEPFPVHVVSVERGFSPCKSVVWIRCPDERMQLTGPVQGMSGSPIFLFPKDQPGEIGRGGKMIGAFAFGYRLGKDCYVGVQPIEQMIDAATRTTNQKADSNQNRSSNLRQHLAASFQLAQSLNLDEADTWRLHALAQLVGYHHNASPLLHAQPAVDRMRLALPVAVSSPDQALLLQHYLAPLGLAATPQSLASPLPPRWIDPDSVKLEPGSVFAIPLVSGPLDMSAVGTTTEVLPDGTALGFGHQFMAEGAVAVPMATGFVHFIQPNLSASFKLGGSLKIVGAVTRDESVAVIGKPDASFPSVPVTVRIRWPEKSLDRDYQYRIVHHDRLLPALMGAATTASLTTDTTLPRTNTLRVQSTLNFANGKSLAIDRLIPNGTTGQMMIATVPALSVLMDNEFGTLQVQSIDTQILVDHDVHAAAIVSATLEDAIVKPGHNVVAHIRLKPYRGPEILRRIQLAIPTDTADGQYNLVIGGAQTYHQQRMATRPHLMRAANPDELFQAVEQQVAVRDDALYAILTLKSNHLAVGRTELPNLPSSRLAMLAVDTSTRATPYVDGVELIEPLPFAVLGQMSLPVTVRRESNRSQ